MFRMWLVIIIILMGSNMEIFEARVLGGILGFGWKITDFENCVLFTQ
jgi:hypothetical protein